MTLPDDICRCHDTVCPAKETCQRWLERHTGRGQTVHTASLFPQDGHLWAPCPSHIPTAPRAEPCPD